MLCRERGIRTPGPVTVNGFQDRRIRPLCHLSLINVSVKSDAKIAVFSLQAIAAFAFFDYPGLNFEKNPYSQGFCH